MGSHFIYITRCNDNSLYVGYTNNTKVRINKHNTGKGAKYTKTRHPVMLVHQEMYETKSEALHREYEVKTFTGQRKLKLTKEGQYGNFIPNRNTYR